MPDENITTQAQAVEFCKSRAQRAKNNIEHAGNNISALFALPALLPLRECFHKMFEWRNWRKAIFEKFIKMGVMGLFFW